MSNLIPQGIIEQKIFMIRGQKIMIDRELAELYGVETRILNQAVRRNIGRFPEDFMFQLTKKEMKDWISQIVISKREKMGLRRMPYVFTQNGVAMLSSVLNSERAIQVNIAIMRVFVRFQEILSTHRDLIQKLNELEKKIEKHDTEIQAIFEAIRQLMTPPERPRRQIGFH